MIGWLVVIILALLWYIWLRRIFEDRLCRNHERSEKLQKEYEALLKDNARISQDNQDLKNSLEETIALYDITKHICAYLDEAEMLSSFQEKLKNYLKVSDCQFIKGKLDESAFAGYVVMPFKVDTHPIGHLAVKLVNQDGVDKFNILTQQLLLGLRRSYLYRKIQEIAISDGLTGIFSRRYFFERFCEEVERSCQFNHQFGFLMVDVDHFKRHNDQYGHLVGDMILREVARVIKGNLRQIDIVGRYGGEEFAIILSETDKSGTLFAAERIRRSVEDTRIRAYDEDLAVTLSIGISMFPNVSREVSKLVEAADKALYQAKGSGRNRVCIYEPGK
jgi:diguanylate cyclase (GGDEF)-like protein